MHAAREMRGEARRGPAIPSAPVRSSGCSSELFLLAAADSAKPNRFGPAFPFEEAVRRRFLQAGEATNSEARAGRGEGLQAFGRLREILKEEGTRFLEEETRREKRELTSRGSLTLRLPEFCHRWNSCVEGIQPVLV